MTLTGAVSAISAETLADFVPEVEVVTLDCGHWIQQKKSAELNAAILSWLGRQHAAQHR